MNAHEISKKARACFKSHWCTGIALHYYFLFTTVLILAVIRVFVLFSKQRIRPFDLIYEYVPQKTREISFALILAAFLLVIYVPALFMIRRYYIVIITDKRMSTTRRFFGANLTATQKVAISCAMTRVLLKSITLTPALLSSYMVYRCAFVSRLENLSTIVLIVFMLALGFTIVWAGLWIRYCISLCLAPYIITLSPKMNPFDACDLSCRLMDGAHLRYLTFWLYNLRFIVPSMLLFPACLCLPIVRISYTYFVKDLLGVYWQDKYPLMIERWKRRALSL